LAEFESGGDEAQVAYGSTVLAGIRLYQGRADEAIPPLRRALRLNKELQSPRGVAHVLETAALLAREAETAGRLLGKADGLRDEIVERLPAPFGPYARAVAVATETLGQAGFAAVHAEGREMSLDDAVALALGVIDA
jgi:hypothetical protein